MKYSHVIFDIGGTLVRWGDSVLFARFLSSHTEGVGPENMAGDAAALRRLMIRKFTRHRRAAIGMGATDDSVVGFWRGVLKETLDLWERPGYGVQILEPLTQAVVMGQFDSLFDDTLDTLERLRAAGYRLGVISNWNKNLPSELARLDIDRFFDFVVVSSLVGVAKPSPEIFRIGLELAGCQPQEALYVGDNVMDDCGGARSVEMDVALIRAGTDVQTEEPSCTAVYPSLTELTDALLHEGFWS
jgi:putative hydrolase of the HAD superfamily